MISVRISDMSGYHYLHCDIHLLKDESRTTQRPKHSDNNKNGDSSSHVNDVNTYLKWVSLWQHCKKKHPNEMCLLVKYWF